jgi:predicted  nucleic acid-binding Zn-ribbon protein
MMPQIKETMKNDNNKAEKVLEISEYIQDMNKKFKAVKQSFREEIKRAEKEREDILNGEMTTMETISNVADIHDLEVVK